MTSIFTDQPAPSEADFLDIAEAAFASLPEGFRQLCGNVVIQVADFADADTLAALEIEHPYELSGLYHGVDLTCTRLRTVWIRFGPSGFPRPLRHDLRRRAVMALVEQRADLARLQ